MPHFGDRKIVRNAIHFVRRRFLHEGSFLRKGYAYYRNYRRRIYWSIFLLAHLLGALSSVDAVMRTRTSQGAIAWAVSLNTFPYVAVPAYWIFGHDEFDEYVDARREVAAQELGGKYSLPALGESVPGVSRQDGPAMDVLQKLAQHPPMKGNEVDLLIDGEDILDSMCEALALAKDYVLVQFYIFRDDSTGQRMVRTLRECRARGVRVLLLYDAYGSMMTPNQFFKGLAADGIEVAAFRAERDGPVDFEVNYRNHRKVIVVDGQTAFVGGMNVGDEYLSKDPEIGYWRDTHMKVTGPVVPFVQRQFSVDWRWVTGESPEGLNWKPDVSNGSATALAIGTGPADDLHHCALMFQAAILAARERVWISTPYFAPDEAMVSSLTLAALRGVDVRILVPEEGDSFPVHQATYSYLPELERAGIELFWYPRGVLHQKAVLVDDELAIIGSANFDNRSFRLNFEMSLAVWHDRHFLEAVNAMLEADFDVSRRARASEMEDASFLFRLSSEVFRLFAPIH